MKLVSTLSVVALLVLNGCSSAQACGDPNLPEVRTVQSVDLNRYLGTWHQIAFFPTRFQGKCKIDTTATYGLLPDGRISVRNECTRPDGKRKSIEGSARVVDKGSNARLKVKFFWFAPAGDYWIIELDPDYQVAVVGAPDRNYLWILSRTPRISRSLYENLLARVAAQQFDVKRIELTSELLP
jgi:apolipoprotein D and lipocalin family protein